MYPIGVQFRAASAPPSGGAPVTNETERYDPSVTFSGQIDFPMPAAAQEVLSFAVGGAVKDEPTEYIVLGSPGSLTVRWLATAASLLPGSFDLDPQDDIEILYKT